MNCFSCHGGSVYGTPTPGAPNNQYALQTMTEELRATKFRLGKPFSRMDMGALFIPLGDYSWNDERSRVWNGAYEQS